MYKYSDEEKKEKNWMFECLNTTKVEELIYCIDDNGDSNNYYGYGYYSNSGGDDDSDISFNSYLNC